MQDLRKLKIKSCKNICMNSSMVNIHKQAHFEGDLRTNLSSLKNFKILQFARVFNLFRVRHIKSQYINVSRSLVWAALCKGFWKNPSRSVVANLFRAAAHFYSRNFSRHTISKDKFFGGTLIKQIIFQTFIQSVVLS
jgi:hypothetical protein